MLNDLDPLERKHGIDAGFVWCEVSELTIVYADLGISDGMSYGIAHAAKHGKPIEWRYLGPPWFDFKSSHTPIK